MDMRLIHKAAQFINQLIIAAFGIVASSHLFVFTYLDVIITDVHLSPVTALPLSPDAPLPAPSSLLPLPPVIATQRSSKRNSLQCENGMSPSSDSFAIVSTVSSMKSKGDAEENLPSPPPSSLPITHIHAIGDAT